MSMPRAFTRTMAPSPPVRHATSLFSLVYFNSFACLSGRATRARGSRRGGRGSAGRGVWEEARYENFFSPLRPSLADPLDAPLLRGNFRSFPLRGLDVGSVPPRRGASRGSFRCCPSEAGGCRFKGRPSRPAGSRGARCPRAARRRRGRAGCRELSAPLPRAACRAISRAGGRGGAPRGGRPPFHRRRRRHLARAPGLEREPELEASRGHARPCRPGQGRA